MLGAILAVPYVWLAVRSRRPVAVFAIGMVVAAAIYVVFALVAGDSRTVFIELGGVALIAIVAAAGLRWSAHLVAVGWLGHVAWDLLLHPVLDNSHAPWWYPALCLGFDLFVAGSIVVWARFRP